MRALAMIAVLCAPTAAWAGDGDRGDGGDARGDGDHASQVAAMAAAVLVAPAIPDGRSMADEIADKISALGAAIDAHLGTLTLDSFDLHIDGRRREARLSLRGGNRHLSLDVDGRIHFEHGRARVAAQIDLGLAGKHLHLDVPDFELVPRSFAGERYVEWQLPIFEGSF